MAQVTTGRGGLRDIVVESVNAKDPDLLYLADDIDIPPEMVEDVLEVMERWPRVMLGRGELDTQPVAVVWAPDSDGLYAPAGFLEFSIEDGAARMDLVPGTPPDLFGAAPPGLEVSDWGDAGSVGEGWVV